MLYRYFPWWIGLTFLACPGNGQEIDNRTTPKPAVPIEAKRSYESERSKLLARLVPESRRIFAEWLACPAGMTTAHEEDTWQDCAPNDRSTTIRRYCYIYPNYKLKSCGTFKNGERDGVITSWTYKGVKIEESVMCEGRKCGRWSEWYEDGKLSRDGEYNNEGQLLWIMYYSPTGRSVSEAEWEEIIRELQKDIIKPEARLAAVATEGLDAPRRVGVCGSVPRWGLHGRMHIGLRPGLHLQRRYL